MKNMKMKKPGDKMAKIKKISPSTLLFNKKIQKLLIAIFTFIILFIICAVGIIPKKYSLKAGDISPADIKAPRDFVDDAATKIKTDDAVSQVPHKYVKNEAVQTNAIEGIKKYFDFASQVNSSNDTDEIKLEKLKNEGSLNLKAEDLQIILKLRTDDIKTLSSFLQNCASKILSQNIRSDSEDDLKKANDDLNFYITNSSLTKPMKTAGEDICLLFIKPNLIYDNAKTEELRSDAKKQVEPVIIRKNQTIVNKSELITAQNLNLLRKAGLLQEKAIIDLSLYSGIAAVIIIFEIIITLFLKIFRNEIYESNSKLVIISIIVCVNALFTAGINSISGYLIPAGLISLLCILIFDPFVAFSISIPFSIIASCITNFNYDVVSLYVCGSITAILFSKHVHERNNVIFVGMFIGVINSILIFAMGLINNIDTVQNLISSTIGIAGGVLTAILAIGILPVFEQFFDIITPIKLLELSNPNQPLLKRMLFEAPGTYHHSILVGNLAEAAADEVKANSLLARVGSYYHDIGKIKRPYFFKENQITNDNPHDKITPKLSTMIITSHVKDGLDLADKYRLPEAIKKIIVEHHGTTLVKYFYAMAVNDGSENVEASAFRYEGPKPSTKESAIVMLADSVEAAVRSLGSPKIADIENMVEKIVSDKVKDGQLDDSDITLKDLTRIKNAFINVLKGMFHSRIEYPEIEEQNSDKEKSDDRI